MRRSFICVAATFIAAFAAGSAAPARAQGQRAGTVIVPPSNVLPPQDRGTHAHTNFLIFRPSQGGNPAGLVGPSPAGETPSSLACVYQVGSQSLDPTTSKNCPLVYGSSGSSAMNYDNPGGGSNVIAIVDAYDYPTAASDFQTFSDTFGLPYGNTACGGGPCFTKVYASGSTPRSNSGWAQEAALDIEWAHAMAPYAQIVLVEAASNSNNDLFQAVAYANNYIAIHGGVGEVSMSWGGSESSSESSYDTYFAQPGVTYFASSGDSGGKVIYPSASPYVVSAGGTTVNRDSSGNFLNETTWSSAGGGASSYETMLSYQDITSDVNKTGKRGTPDISFDANPYTGVSVYDSTASQGLSGWLVFGGTSVSSPSLAGIVNNAGAFGDGSNTSVQNNLYSNYASDASSTTDPTTCLYNSLTPFNDITSGSKVGTYSASGCWDFASGIGTLRGSSGLAGSGSNNGGGGGTSVTVSSLTLDPTSVTANTSSTGTVTLSAASSSDTTVALSSNSSYASVPTGVTVLAGNTSATFQVTTSSPPSTTVATITATYPQGSPGVTAQLTVSPASTSGGTFSVSASAQTPTSVSPGQNATYTVTVNTNNGFSGSVNLSVSGLPKFAHGSFATDPVTVSGSATSTTLTVRTNKNIASGSTTQFTITGTSGSQIVSTTATLSVQ